MIPLISLAKKMAATLSPQFAAWTVLRLSPLLALISSRHRERFRLLRRLRGPSDTLMLGPFAGMRYLNFAVGSQLLPKFAGTYECELHEILARIVRLSPRVVVDIGSAEGYYAVGLALRIPQAHVFAFDLDRLGNALCRILARRNGVNDRVEIGVQCTSRTLEHLLASPPGTLIICDVEGAEDEILCPASTPSLQKASVLVEVHNDHRPGVSDRLNTRFQGTHHIEVIQQARRDPSMVPAKLAFTEAEAGRVMDEDRKGTQQWFWMTPRLEC